MEEWSMRHLVRAFCLLFVFVCIFSEVYAESGYLGNCYEGFEVNLDPSITQLSLVSSESTIMEGEEVQIQVYPQNLAYYCWTASDGYLIKDNDEFRSVRWRAETKTAPSDVVITGFAGNNNGGLSEESITIHVTPQTHRYDLVPEVFEMVNHDVFLREKYRLDLEVRVVNNGPEEINDDFRVSFIFSDDDQPGNDVTAVSDLCRESCREEFNRDGYKVFAEDLHLPDYVEPGDYNILVHVDSENLVNESDEENNFSSLAVYIVDGEGSGSDLVVENFQSEGRDDPLDVLFNEDIYVSLDVVNIGQMQSSQCSGTFHWSTEPLITADSVILESYNINRLNPGESRELLNTVTIPENVPEGTYYLLFEADDEYEVNETDENNNVGLFAFNVHSGADLVIQNLQVNQQYDEIVAEIGHTIRVDADIANIGPERARQTEVGWYISTSTSIDDHVHFHSSHIPNVYPGEPFSMDAYIDLDPDVPPGNYYVIVEADTFDDFIEQNEENNTTVLPFLLQGEPELDGIIVEVDSEVVDIGQEITATAIGYYNDYTSLDITDQVEWNSSDPTVLEYVESNRFLALSDGFASISATLDGIVSLDRTVEVLPAQNDPPLLLKLLIFKRILDCLLGEIPRDSPECSFLPH